MGELDKVAFTVAKFVFPSVLYRTVISLRSFN